MQHISHKLIAIETAIYTNRIYMNSFYLVSIKYSYKALNCWSNLTCWRKADYHKGHGFFFTSLGNFFRDWKGSYNTFKKEVLSFKRCLSLNVVKKTFLQTVKEIWKAWPVQNYHALFIIRNSVKVGDDIQVC